MHRDIVLDERGYALDISQLAAIGSRNGSRRAFNADSLTVRRVITAPVEKQ